MTLHQQSASEYHARCIVAAGKSSYEQYSKLLAEGSSDHRLLFICESIEKVSLLPSAHHYSIATDMSLDDNVSILCRLLNDLLCLPCSITVQILQSGSTTNTNGTDILRKLASGGLIQVEVLSVPPADMSDTTDSEVLQNTTCFIGPGSTGKASIITSLGDIYLSAGKSVAYLDITADHKLKYYHPVSVELFESNSEDAGNEAASRILFSPLRDMAVLYTLDSHPDAGLGNEECITRALKLLSKKYDAVLVNTDVGSIHQSPRIFHQSARIFMICDHMPNHADITHCMLQTLSGMGTEIRDKISLVYNKVEKGLSTLRYVEEKILFENCTDTHWKPLLDIQCCTFEIPYGRKTLAALTRRCFMGSPSLHATDRAYRKSLMRMYQFIHQQPLIDKTEMQIHEFIGYYTAKLWHNRFFSTFRLIYKQPAKKQAAIPEDSMIQQKLLPL